MAISVDTLIQSLETSSSHSFNADQVAAIRHGAGPLWIIAGPGTGKTEVLVARCLRLLCCDNIDPRSILVTTFTEKAAFSLQQRIADGFSALQDIHSCLNAIDTSGLRVGTLHSLCNDILQECRYDPYRNLRLLDDVESAMLIRSKIAPFVRSSCSNLIAGFRYLFPHWQQLSLWDISKGLAGLLSRMVEDDIDLQRAVSKSPAWNEAVAAASLYDQTLAEKHACDFARLQRHFLNFLSTPSGATFLNGDVAAAKPPLLHVLVDEYQDTNPLQERIYFALAAAAPHNIAVVGDDDQALYRFRGGSVECMIGFNAACQAKWGVSAQPVQLRNNYRSHHRIVHWCEDYISNSPAMATLNSRAPGKFALVPSSGRNANYPAVGYIQASRLPDLANAFATTVAGLHHNGIITDLSQCVLLLRSTKEGAQGAGPYVSALRAATVPFYNPRSKSFVEQSEVQLVLGCLIAVLDPRGTVAATIQGTDLQANLAEWLTVFNSSAPPGSDLRSYVSSSNARLAQLHLGDEVTPAVPTVLYRILAMQPFPNIQQEVERDLRLSKVTRLFEAFCAQFGRRLKMDSQQAGQVNNWWMSQFYYVFCGYLSSFGIDDDEEEEVIVPPGRVPIMTIHQAKGLEFDVVFVGSLGRSVDVGPSIQLEEACLSVRQQPPPFVIPMQDRAWHDEVRAHYVAYSRAKHALVLLTTTSQLSKKDHQTPSFGRGGGTDFRRRFPRL